MELPKSIQKVTFMVDKRGEIHSYKGVFRRFNKQWCFFISPNEYYLPEQVMKWIGGEMSKVKRKVLKDEVTGRFAPKTADPNETVEYSVNTDRRELQRLKEAVEKVMPILEHHINNEAHSVEDRRNVEALQDLVCVK